MNRYLLYGLVIVLCYAIPFSILQACSRAEASTVEPADNQVRRIKLEAQTNINGAIFFILNVDGKRYLAQNRGGITPLID